MNLDDLIPFIVFLIYVGFMLFKKATKKKPGTGAPPQEKSGKKKSFGLSKLVDTIKAELERAALEAKQKQAAADSTAWNYADGDDDFEDLKPDPGPIFVDPIQVKPASKPPPIKIKQPPDLAGVCDRKKAPAARHKRQRSVQNRLRLSPAKLKEAVVLSEIIAKPLALRD